MMRRISAISLRLGLFGLVVVAPAHVWAQATATKAPDAATKVELRHDYFDSNGVKIHYATAGEGEPVVLIHGFSANLQMNWQSPKVIDELAEDYQVIAIDNRGHGRSDKPHEPEKYGLEMVEDIVRLLDHLKLDKAHVVGYSMGGFITSRLLATHADRLLSATLGGAGWSREGDSRMEFLKELAESLEAGKGITPLILRLVPEGQPKPSEEELQTMNQLVMALNDPLALAAVIRGMKGLTVTEQELRANKVPTLALIGALDPLKAGVDEMQKVMGKLDVVVIDDADHMSAFRSPVFVESLKAFLAEHSREPAAATAN